MSADEKFFELDKSRVRILVTDDENSIREMLVLTLKEDGWNVDSAENGRVAFEKCCKNPYHIILSDIQMPEMSGIEMLEAVKKKFPNIEVVIMTSNATLETAVKAIKAGANDYLNKPFEDLSIVPRKMHQVAERIMLRQQNGELLKRLKRSTLHLKLLFDATRDLNGILDLENLQASTLKSLPALFQDPTAKALWLKKDGEQWKVAKRIPDDQAFEGLSECADLDEIASKFPAYRKLKTVRLEYAGEIREALVFENLAEHLADFFCQEVRTCFEKVSLHEKILGLANKDGLTMLYNHRYFQDRLRQELAQAKRQNSPCTVVLLDIDHFKHYNDKHGHPAGDALLRNFAKVLSKECGNRESDIVARYGGEEFIALLPFTPVEGGKTKAERIRDAILKFPFEFGAEQPLGLLSASIGVATFPTDAESASELVEAADKALYQAKHGGRNQVKAYSEIAEAKPKTEAAPVVENIPAPAVESLPPPDAAPVPAPVAEAAPEVAIKIESEPVALEIPGVEIPLPTPDEVALPTFQVPKPGDLPQQMPVMSDPAVVATSIAPTQADSAGFIPPPPDLVASMNSVTVEQPGLPANVPPAQLGVILEETDTLELPDPAALEAALAKLTAAQPPPSAPVAPPPVTEAPKAKATLEDVLKEDAPAPKANAAPGVELSSLMTSIESAFANADTIKEDIAKKGSGA